MSLLDNVKEQTPSQEGSVDQGKGSQDEWYWADGVRGEGDRPEFLSSKYKSVAEMAKAQRELELRLGQAPKEYDFSKADWLDVGYEPIQKMAEFAKSKHVPQDVMDVFVDSVGRYIKSKEPNPAEEIQKLGENAEQRLSVLKNWAKSNLSDGAYNSLTGKDGLLNTADSIKALEELREKSLSSDSVVPGASNASVGSNYTLDEWKAELHENFEKFQKDPSAYAAHQKKLQRIKGG